MVFNNFENFFIQIFSIILLLVSRDASSWTHFESKFFFLSF